ncbi:hypothetical protein GCM10027091_45460 [Streptomyces daliensis]
MLHHTTPTEKPYTRAKHPTRPERDKIMFTARIALATAVLAAIAALSSATTTTATPAPGHTLPTDSPGLLSGNA